MYKLEVGMQVLIADHMRNQTKTATVQKIGTKWAYTECGLRFEKKRLETEERAFCADGAVYKNAEDFEQFEARSKLAMAMTNEMLFGTGFGKLDNAGMAQVADMLGIEHNVKL